MNIIKSGHASNCFVATISKTLRHTNINFDCILVSLSLLTIWAQFFE